SPPPPSYATFTYPNANAQNVDTGKAFSWTTVPGALAYYLYVGTSQGAKDLVNTGEIPQTSYTVPPLPTGVTLWARIWTKKAAATWCYEEITFSAAARRDTRFEEPRAGAQNGDTAKPCSWTEGPGALAYYVYAGRSQGAKDLVNTGEIPQTSYTVPPLPTGVTLWARIWTKKAAPTWSYADITFTAAPGHAT